jgi:hypothetical protein
MNGEKQHMHAWYPPYPNEVMSHHLASDDRYPGFHQQPQQHDTNHQPPVNGYYHPPSHQHRHHEPSCQYGRSTSSSRYGQHYRHQEQHQPSSVPSNNGTYDPSQPYSSQYAYYNPYYCYAAPYPYSADSTEEEYPSTKSTAGNRRDSYQNQMASIREPQQQATPTQTQASYGPPVSALVPKNAAARFSVPSKADDRRTSYGFPTTSNLMHAMIPTPQTGTEPRHRTPMMNGIDSESDDELSPPGIPPSPANSMANLCNAAAVMDPKTVSFKHEQQNDVNKGVRPPLVDSTCKNHVGNIPTESHCQQPHQIPKRKQPYVEASLLLNLRAKSSPLTSSKDSGTSATFAKEAEKAKPARTVVQPKKSPPKVLPKTFFPCPVPENYPTRLAMDNDHIKLNSLHCFLREKLLELFVVAPSKSKVKFQHAPSSSVGRVGLRCIFCQEHRQHHPDKDDTDDAPMAVFYPKNVNEIYRLVTSWQRCHVRKCKNLPPSLRSEWNKLRATDRSRGKTVYWTESALNLGLTDAPCRMGGIYFDINKIPKDDDSDDEEEKTGTGEQDEQNPPTETRIETNDDVIEFVPIKEKAPVPDDQDCKCIAREEEATPMETSETGDDAAVCVPVDADEISARNPLTTASAAAKIENTPSTVLRVLSPHHETENAKPPVEHEMMVAKAAPHPLESKETSSASSSSSSHNSAPLSVANKLSE